MFTCSVCEEYSMYALCNDCRVIRHIVTLNGKKRVLEVLHSIFQRCEEKQNNKIQLELKNEIENQTYKLKKVKT